MTIPCTQTYHVRCLRQLFALALASGHPPRCCGYCIPLSTLFRLYPPSPATARPAVAESTNIHTNNNNDDDDDDDNRELMSKLRAFRGATSHPVDCAHCTRWILPESIDEDRESAFCDPALGGCGALTCIICHGAAHPSLAPPAPPSPSPLSSSPSSSEPLPAAAATAAAAAAASPVPPPLQSTKGSTSSGMMRRAPWARNKQAAAQAEGSPVAVNLAVGCTRVSDKERVEIRYKRLVGREGWRACGRCGWMLSRDTGCCEVVCRCGNYETLRF